MGEVSVGMGPRASVRSDHDGWFRHTSLVMVSKNFYVRSSGYVIADVSVVDVLA